MKRWLSRSTMFAVFFALTAFILAILGKLTDSYALAITAIHAFIVVRAIAEDKYKSNQ